jgi:DNA polymerase I-like protein with 3'-5' exonuclease and polymerase domains
MKEVEVFTMWHPAATYKDKAKVTRGFLTHCDKLGQIALGKQAEEKPRVIINPAVSTSKKYLNLKKWWWFAVDIETPGLDDSRMESVAASGDPNLALVYDLRVRRVREKLLGPLMEALEDEDFLKVVQNGDFDINVFRKNGWKCSNFWDTMIEAQIKHPDEPVNLSFLTSMVRDTYAWKHMRGSELLVYNGWDAAHDAAIFVEEGKEVDKYVERRMSLLENVIIPLNNRGVNIDEMRRRQLLAERQKRLKSWTSRVTKHFKARQWDSDMIPIGPQGGFSYKKMQALLYDTLGLPVKYSPSTGSITTDQKAMAALKKVDRTGTVDLLYERSEMKDAETPLKTPTDADGRIRTRFVFGGDEKHDALELGKESPGSGRLASRDPNLQNWTEWVRQIIIPTDRGGWLLKADYSQIEMRLIAHLSGSSRLRQATETDGHLWLMYLVDKATGMHGLYKRGWDKLLKQYKAGDPQVVYARDEQKRANYGWFYRMGAKKLENVYGIPFKRGKQALLGLNDAFPRVVQWWASLEGEVRRTAKGSGWGWLTNDYGRKRYFFMDEVPAMCNFKPQSLAADILFDAMEEAEANMSDYGANLVLTVHDELVFDLYEGANVKEVMGVVKEIMEFEIPELGGLKIPVDIKVGKNWAKFHKHSKACRPCSQPENPLGQQDWSKWKKAA